MGAAKNAAWAPRRKERKLLLADQMLWRVAHGSGMRLAVGMACLLLGACRDQRFAATKQDQLPRREASPAMTAYRDPVTGAFGRPPAATSPVPFRASSSLAAAPNQGLGEEAAPAGGTMVRLQGHLRSQMVAGIDPAGRVSTTCATANPPSR